MYANQLHIYCHYKIKYYQGIIKAYITSVNSTFGGSKYILSDEGSEFTSKQFTFLAKNRLYQGLYITIQPYRKFNNRIDAFFSKNIHNKSIDIHWQIIRHSTKQACMQGGLWNQYTDPIEGENLLWFYVAMKFIHEKKTK